MFQQTYREGFWKSISEKDLPWPGPSHHKWEGRLGWLTKLTFVEDKLSKPTSYRGFSLCRLCGTLNGTKEYMLNDWVWPSGYKHYIEDHEVQPSLAFQEFVNAVYENTKEQDR